MYPHRVLPMLLLAGAAMMIMRHNRPGFMSQGEESDKHGPFGLHHGPFSGPHGEWGKRVPPLFEKWHKQMHEQETQPAAS
ncbi:hypothetical protein TFLX_03906 [Thermoflexales bacterium]|nr:hypothetical protein TFLX_03906 [Thermoflexales bacterium]